MRDFKSEIRNVPDFPVAGIQFKDITTLIKDPQAYHEAIDELARSVEGKEIDVVVGPEAGGLSWAARSPTPPTRGLFWPASPASCPPRSRAMSISWSTARTPWRSIWTPSQRAPRCSSPMTCWPRAGTAMAVVKLVESMGGEVVGLRFLIELEDLGGRKALEGYDVASLVQY